MKIDTDWCITKNNYECPYCQKHYTKKGICSHIQRTHLGIKFGSGNNGHYDEKSFRDKISKTKKKRFDEKFGKIKKFEVICFRCKKIFIVNEKEYKFPEKEKYYCSDKCAHIRDFTEEQKKEISKKAKKHHQDHPEKYPNRLLWDDKKRYRKSCQFEFNLSNYPFDFNLIKKYGWYCSSNRGNNLNGISRDHIVSIDYGYKNNIDPLIIKHPANCQLLRHNENSSKHTNCGLLVEELKIKIDNWDKIYSSHYK